MFTEFLAVLHVAGETLLKLVPISIGARPCLRGADPWQACNPGQLWFRKREIVTDVCYWFLMPLGSRFVRIGLMVMGAAYIFDIHGERRADRFLRERLRSARRTAALGAGDHLPGGVGFPALLDSSRSIMAAACGNTTRCIIPRKTSTGSRRRAFTRSISCSRHHRGRRRPAARRHLAERDAVGRAVHHRHRPSCTPT